MGSKIGVHVFLGPRNNYGPFLTHIAEAGKTLAVVKMVDDFGAADEALNLMPNCLTVGRLNSIRDADGNLIDLQAVEPLNPDGTYKNPVSVAQWYFGLVAPKWRFEQKRVKVWETFNEFSAHWGWQSDFYLAMMDLADAEGFKLSHYACSTGNPQPNDFAAMMPCLQVAKQRDHYFSLHEYGGVGTTIQTLQGTQPYHALRYRDILGAMRQANANCRIILSEVGQAGGHQFLGTDILIPDLAWYDSEIRQDDEVVAGAAWTLGQTAQWPNSNIQDALPALAEYIVSIPDEEPPPMREYDRTYVLFHADDYKKRADGTPSPWPIALLSAPWWNNQLWTMGQSADDTFIKGGDVITKRRRGIAINPHKWGSNPTLKAWADSIFSAGFEYVPITADTPAQMISEIERVVLGVQPSFKLSSPIGGGIPLSIIIPGGEFNAPRDYNFDGTFDDKHEGVDLKAKDANGNPVPILAAHDGEVIWDQDFIGGAYGIFVFLKTIHNGQEWVSEYAHLTRNTVVIGQQVQVGQQIGMSGATGNATGIHLHFNLRKIGGGLAGYVRPDVVDPTPYLPLGTSPPPPPPPPPILIGLHGYAGGGGNRELDYRNFTDSRAECALITTNSPPSDFDRLVSLGIPPDRIIYRLLVPTDRAITADEAYSLFGEPTANNPIWPLSWFRLHGGKLVLIHNEPNHPFEGMGLSWKSPIEWTSWWTRFVFLARGHYPSLRFGLPGLWPEPNIGLWLTAYQGVIGLADWVSAHAYWVQDGIMASADIGGMLHEEHGAMWKRYVRAFPGKEIWLTEAANINGTVAYDIKGRQYATVYPSTLQGIKGLAYYISSTDTPGEITSRQNWNGTNIAQTVGAR